VAVCYLQEVFVVVVALIVAPALDAAVSRRVLPSAADHAAADASARRGGRGAQDAAPAQHLAQGEEGDSPAERLDDAAAAFDALELEIAAQTLEALVASPDADDPVRARAWLLLGQTRAGLLDDDGARAAFAAALAVDPALTLPPGTSPKVQALFDRTRGSLLRDMPERLVRRSPEGTATPSAAPSTTAQPPASLEEASAVNPGFVALTLVGSALLTGAVAAAVGGFVADETLGRPVAGRSRDEYEQVRTLGIASLVGSVVLGVAGLTALTVGALWSIDAPAVTP
jgi:hypothetical protein